LADLGRFGAIWGDLGRFGAIFSKTHLVTLAAEQAMNETCRLFAPHKVFFDLTAGETLWP
jgi:hypothetical protein